MKRHYIQCYPDRLEYFKTAFAICGISRCELDPKAETKKKRLVTCKKCLRALEKKQK